MSKDAPKSLSELITQKSGALGDLASQAQLREDLGSYLRTQLPPELAAGFRHCNLTADTLVVIASTPEWASRLRFEAGRFAELCAAQGIRVTQVKFRVAAG